MDFQRLFLFLIFSFSLMMVWDGWQRYQHPQTVVVAAAEKSELPVTEVKTNDVAEHAAIAQRSIKAESGKIIKVKTDLMDVEINTLGGDIQGLSFLKHPDRLDKTKNFALFEKGPGTHDYVAQTGLLGADMPNHTSMFSSEQDSYILGDNTDKLQVKLTAEGLNGFKVAKLITFHRDSYVIDVTYEIENNTSAAIKTSAYYQFIRDGADPAGVSKMVPTFTGVAVYTLSLIHI